MVKRCGKSAPVPVVTSEARQTPPGARPNREQSRSGSLRLPGRLLEAAGNRRRRGMAVGGAAPVAPVTEPGLQALAEIFLFDGSVYGLVDWLRAERQRCSQFACVGLTRLSRELFKGDLNSARIVIIFGK
jgi:hypothetical protein